MITTIILSDFDTSEEMDRIEIHRFVDEDEAMEIARRWSKIAGVPFEDVDVDVDITR